MTDIRYLFEVDDGDDPPWTFPALCSNWADAEEHAQLRKARLLGEFIEEGETPTRTEQ